MYRSIVVPLDGSKFGEKALPYAVMLARAAGATLHLVHVHNGKYGREVAYLTNLAARITREHGLPSTSVLAEGRVVGEIGRAVSHANADLVVMAMHVRGPLAKLWRGSVVNTLIRTVAVPVLLINSDAPDRPELSKDGFRRIVVALDGSELAEEALGYGVALATSPAAELVLVSAVENDDVHNIAMSDSSPAPNPVWENAPDLDVYYERLSKRLHVPFEIKLVRDEYPAAAIIAAAEECGGDVIAIATHGRSGLSRLLFGSVAEAVLQSCHIPVLIFRPVGVLEPATVA